MNRSEKRQFSRLEAQHLVDYQVIDDDGNPTIYSMGRTTDISADGIKLETKHKISLYSILLLSIGLEENIIDIEAVTTHSSSIDGGFLAGIKILEIRENNHQTLIHYVNSMLALPTSAMTTANR